ncbi:MAG: uroporphyrinogen-III C-methyltransferase, partial [Halioglobus sp.]|nr:uroporphyrinogen-III C-methyltransferase [Halioglobus sp.]
MSDRQDRDTERPGQEDAGVVPDAPDAQQAHDATDEPGQAEPATAASRPASSAATTARGGSPVIGWLALLLVLALGAGALWWYLQSQELERELRGRIVQLEAAADGRETDVAALGARWQEQLGSDVERMRSGLRGELGTELRHQLQVDLRDELHGTLSRELLQESRRQAAAIESFAAELARQREQLARYSANDGESWLLAEAEYLLRLANQRVIMTGDAVAAQTLLETADDILQEVDDPGLHRARAAIAADVAALRAVPGVDVEGLYLRLAALLEQADALVIFELPEVEAQPRAEEADTWRGRLQQGYESALRKLSDYIVIRRRDVPVQSLMDPQWEGLVRQNL